jgi:hypothetical protein
MENELKNLEVTDTSDNVNKAMRIRRRNPKIQKDFFSATEYAIYAINTHIEIEHYSHNRRRKGNPEDYVMID